jgi:hypothetical protein
MEKPNFEGYIDPSLPQPFKYTEKDRAEMLKNGLSEEEINVKEALANSGTLEKVESKITEEMRTQGIKRDESGNMEGISAEEARAIIREFDERGKDQAA